MMVKVTEGGLEAQAMTEREFRHYRETGCCDPKFCFEYDPEVMARIKEAAENLLPERFTADEYLELLRHRAR